MIPNELNKQLQLLPQLVCDLSNCLVYLSYMHPKMGKVLLIFKLLFACRNSFILSE